MKASDKLINALKGFEGCRLKAYKCPAGVWTIGYGSTKGVYSGLSITYQDAENRLRKDLEVFERYVNNLNVCKTQGQFDALVDFAYNLGTGNLGSSTLLKKIRAGVNSPTLKQDFDAVCKTLAVKVDRQYSREEMYERIIRYQMLRWNKAGGKVLTGLAKRRQWEADRFFEV